MVIISFILVTLMFDSETHPTHQSETALPSEFNFSKCILDYNIFTNQNLSNFKAIECSIREAFFSGCDLSKSLFTSSDLGNTHFDECKFKYANFINSINFFITPDNNDIRYAKISVETALGLLDKFHLTIN